MKKTIIFILLFNFILYSCSSALKLKNDAHGNLIDEANGRLYIYCGCYLRAAEINKNIYAKGDEGEKLYEIPGIEPSEWLSEDITKLGMPLLFREAGVEEPKLETFGTEKIHITETAEINVRIGLIDDEGVDTIINNYLYGDAVNAPAEYDYDFTLYFESPKYPGIYYILQYIIGGDGQVYLYDRWTKRCVYCDIKLFGGN